MSDYEVHCPYCGAVQDLADWPMPDPYDEVQKWECDECERDFEWKVEQWTFVSWKLKKADHDRD